MACSDGPWGRGGESFTDKHLGVIVELACTYCRELEARGEQVPENAREWWEGHQKQDKKRLEREEMDRKKEEIKQQGLSKLTAEERAALGLR